MGGVVGIFGTNRGAQHMSQFRGLICQHCPEVFIVLTIETALKLERCFQNAWFFYNILLLSQVLSTRPTQYTSHCILDSSRVLLGDMFGILYVLILNDGSVQGAKTRPMQVFQ